MSTSASLVRGFLVFLAWCAVAAPASAQPSAPRLPVVAEPARAEALAAAAADFAALGMQNAAAIYANHPALAQALGPHLRYIVSGSTLAPRERALVGLRTAWHTIDTVGALTMHAGALNTLGVALEAQVAAERLPDVPRRLAAERTNVRLQGKAPRIPPEEPAAGGRATANVFRTFRRNPPADSVRGAVNTHVNRNSLEPRHREMLLTRIGVLCRSEYEYAAHLRAGTRAGMTQADVALVLAGPEAGAGAPLDLALVRATDELHRDDAVSAQTWAVLTDAFTPERLLDVLFSVGAYRSGSMLINSAGVQLDADMADYRFPPELR